MEKNIKQLKQKVFVGLKSQQQKDIFTKKLKFSYVELLLKIHFDSWHDLKYDISCAEYIQKNLFYDRLKWKKTVF